MAKTAHDVLTAARGQLGYNGDGTPDAPITSFGTWFGVQTQWCAIFVSWCLAAGGVDRLGRWDKGEDYCPAWVQSFQDHDRWKTTDPQPGDVVFYSWDQDGVANHVGLIESATEQDTIVTIEGNTDDPKISAYADGNCCRRKHRDTRYVLGYGIPPYSSTPATDQEDNELNDDQAKKLDDLHALFFGETGGQRLTKLDGMLFAVTNSEGYLQAFTRGVNAILARIAKKLGAN
jgi:hypothetical protein